MSDWDDDEAASEEEAAAVRRRVRPSEAKVGEMAEIRGNDGLQVFPGSEPGIPEDSGLSLENRASSGPSRNTQPTPETAPEGRQSPAQRPAEPPRFRIRSEDGRIWLDEFAYGRYALVEVFVHLEALEGWVLRTEELAREERAALNEFVRSVSPAGSGQSLGSGEAAHG